MRISKNWFIRFEPNFQTEQNTILFNKLSGELFEVTEVYYDFIDSLRIGTDFQKLLLRKYNVNKRRYVWDWKYDFKKSNITRSSY